MAEATFYRCNKCGNLLAVIKKGTCTPRCCGEPMEELKAGSTDAATEKHVPVVTREGGKVKARRVGGAPHDGQALHPVRGARLEGPS